MKVGVAGAGMVVTDFLEAAALEERMEIYGLYARREEMRQEFCEKFGIPNAYDSYEKMLADENIEVVYVALPNTLHFQFAKQALEAGKHVILEKPFTITYEEAYSLAKLARLKNCYLFEAITTIHNPNYAKMKELVSELGDIKLLLLNFSQYSSRYDRFKQGIIFPSFDQEKAGGTLTDLHIYNMHFIMGLFGEPTEVTYHPNMERGVDTSGILMMSYPDFQAVSVAAKDCGAPFCISVQGNKGYLHSTYPTNTLTGFIYKENKGEPQEYRLADCPKRLYYELAAFADHYEAKDDAFFDKYLDHSVSVIKILEKIRMGMHTA